MPREFEVREEIVLPATTEEVWEAIATGPGVDSWFMGANDFEPGVGGAGRQTVAGFTTHATVTGWEPGERLAYTTDTAADGSFMAFEYLLEGRAGGSTVLRFVHSGLLTGDWEDQYDAVSVGDGLYLRKLQAYLRHFPGVTADYALFEIGRPTPDAARVWAAFLDAFSLGQPPEKGRVAVPGLNPDDAQVVFAESGFLCVVTATSLITLVHGYRDAVVAEHHAFPGEIARPLAESAWRAWLEKNF
ncbi:SRPBCC family protein [Herbidospora cretacea]|uniref:SRPBCC family protein n=1 Tax=Herbidospora cretacea TaxID=28444 RepID=UPI0004C3F6B2|nr:SRPBCC domain-containing protein [Herbidospora cretacea]